MFFSSAYYYYFFFLGHFNRQTPQLCTAARHPIVTTSRSFVNVPLKDYIILFAPFFPSAHFSVFILFLPRDNWLIHQCITPPPPDPQHHRHTFPEPCLPWHGWHHHHPAAVSSQNSDELNRVLTSVFLIIFLLIHHPPAPLFSARKTCKWSGFTMIPLGADDQSVCAESCVDCAVCAI